MPPSQKIPDKEAEFDDEIQYGNGPLSREALDEKYNGRPRNHAKTLPFHDLLASIFHPLNENKKRPTGPAVARAKQGPHGPRHLTPHEQRQHIIERFISKWRSEVGNDFYPALRLILPEKDRDRPMYGLKEKAIGKLIVKLLKINPHSQDGDNLLNWKLPGQTTATRMTGDFAGRCYEVLAKRAIRQDFGSMRIAEVNELLDKLSAVSKEEDQLPIFTTFYNRMSADELQWLIRIILRQMRVGASEKTILELWHPDGEALFNVSSSLRRVCWELTDPSQRLESEKAGITLMECFQPQLAQFQMHSFQKMIEKMGCEHSEFWIEEKLDGERMQLHMIEDPRVPGGRRFAFWSRKGKDYTYLYGAGFEDDKSSLTRFIKDAFEPRVRNIILDGEMITWDPETNTMVGFGTLKSAAISEQRNPYDATGHRPLFRVFDCLYLNDDNLTRFTLRDRRNALEKAIKDVHCRLEVHKRIVARDPAEIELELRKVIAEASEGLVLKNPCSIYRLNSRNDDWMKVKPEYMTEFGENLDCVVIGGYYGSGYRGGRLSSFLCGLRASKNHVDQGSDPMRCFSFCKVGGGFRAEDYSKIKHLTDGKWKKWDRDHPPSDLISLGGGDRQFERPDQWIKPCDSVVLEIKAASVGASEQFATGFTLRFPRFKRLRDDKTWEDSLTVDEFLELQRRVEAESKEKDFKVDTKKRMTKRLKIEMVVAGNDSRVKMPYTSPRTEIFEGLKFCVLSEMLKPQKKTKAEIEQVIKANGGVLFQNAMAQEGIICLGDKKVVKVASLIKNGHTNIVRPAWVFDAVEQSQIDGSELPRFLVPFEPDHMFHATEDTLTEAQNNVDEYGDSYARDVTKDKLKEIISEMKYHHNPSFSSNDFILQLRDRGGLGDLASSMFRQCIVRFVAPETDNFNSRLNLQIAKNQFLFTGGKVVDDEDDKSITHFVVVVTESRDAVKALRKKIAQRPKPIPRIVSIMWLIESWEEKTLLDEDHFSVAT